MNPIGPRNYWGRTPKGRVIEVAEKTIRWGGSAPAVQIRHYSSEIGETVVGLSWYRYRNTPSSDAGGATTELTDHDFASGELEAIFDGMNPATVRDVAGLPELSVP